ncbi:Glutaminase A [Pleurostoma richardsiae]|uniref:Glutaminase A n=1 Tax=Pleurostoma richardsiae TaxID=41990 RepID=A0AA38RGW1_9PEZI|nr:Glutaminase A [Pleurostoma richardsiae]
MGAAPGPSTVTQTAFQYTSTRSIFTFDVAGKVTMTVTFLSPVYPNDFVKKSLQYSYVDVSVVSADGSSHSVSVYMDMSGEWMAGDRTTVIDWATGTYNGVAYHKFWNPSQVIYQEKNDQANWGTVFLGTTSGQGMTYQIGEDTVVRTQFVNNRVLNDTVDSDFRAVNSNWPVFAFAHDLGTIGTSAVSVQFGLGLCQIYTINFQGSGSSAQSLQGNWYDEWSDGIYAMADWVSGYSTEATYSTQIDSDVYADSYAAAGSNYAAITTLAVRQAFGGLQPGKGTSQSYLFLKEISSDGDISTVDVIFPAFPILAYFNTTLVKLLLDPLYENQESGHYPNTYSMHDLGTFPNALGYPAGNDEEMPVEECGNMIIMTLSYAQKSGDTAYLTKHYSKLQQWTSYLVNDSLIPANQLSTDDFAGTLANQTNLALKGIIGIAAMGKIAQLTGNSDTYTSTAQSYISQWYSYGINSAASPPHTELDYNDATSWGLLYNLYADKILGLGLVKSAVYDQQSAFYPTVENTYGVPLDTRHTYTKLDWQCWVAAIASNSTRDSFYSTIVSWLGNTSARVPMTDWYQTTDGTSPGFIARPVVGGLFAELAL